MDICRRVYNYAHAQRKAWLESRKSRVDCCSIISEYIISADTPFPNYNIQAKALTEAKKQFTYLKTLNAQCLQQVLKRLDKAWRDFFKIPGRGFPRFRSKNRFRSFVFPQLLKNCLDENRVKLPSIGWVKIRQSRPYPLGFEPKQFQIVRKASGYYLMIVFQSTEIVPEPLPGKTSIGLDAGIESFVATPRELIKSPKFLRGKLRMLKSASDPAPPIGARERASLLQRRLKKKIKGSNNWLKLAHYICDQADNIFVEDINFKSWSKGLFCKQSLDSGIGTFINEILPFISPIIRI